MATKDETNVSKLSQFSALKPFERRAIVLRAEGKSHQEITNQINAEYTLSYSVRTVAEWFQAGSRLELGYLQYNEELAKISLQDAKTKIKKASNVAADTLTELMDKTQESTIRLGASKSILAKFVPDKQIVVDERYDEDDLPDEIATAAAEIVQGDPDGPDKVDEPPQGGDPSQAAGA